MYTLSTFLLEGKFRLSRIKLLEKNSINLNRSTQESLQHKLVPDGLGWTPCHCLKSLFLTKSWYMYYHCCFFRSTVFKSFDSLLASQIQVKAQTMFFSDNIKSVCVSLKLNFDIYTVTIYKTVIYKKDIKNWIWTNVLVSIKMLCSYLNLKMGSLLLCQNKKIKDFFLSLANTCEASNTCIDVNDCLIRLHKTPSKILIL